MQNIKIALVPEYFYSRNCCLLKIVILFKSQGEIGAYPFMSFCKWTLLPYEKLYW